MNNQQKWDLRFVKLAEEVAKWSKDPSTQVGAIAVNRIGSVVAQGYVPRSWNRLRIRIIRGLQTHQSMV